MQEEGAAQFAIVNIDRRFATDRLWQRNGKRNRQLSLFMS
jgi:hypothetical protein